MARHESTISMTSIKPRVDSIKSLNYVDASPLSATTGLNGRRQSPLRTSFFRAPKHDDVTYVDPDELFGQRTVTEVKSVQIQLRADADAKQEELRLMVGERYRDLLQASTSIISIARSSKHVIEVLEETKETILAQDEPPLPKRVALVSKEDAHLQTLQLLSAHMKLLLDAPEHLWRLLERKKYFQAGWLFLLARVVHRALVRDDDQDTDSWVNQGIDVVVQFPLIQRQWDAVSHFRAQIIHKATLSLRSYTVSSEDTCATLLTLHLLDSQPLMETLSILLTQRFKALHALLEDHLEALKPVDSHHAGRNGPQSNGHPPEHKPQVKSSKRRIREVRQSTEVALNAISRTLKTVRDIFQSSPPSRGSMITGILEYIQSDIPNNTSAARTLPAELLITTQTLLTTLPSSTHFLLLPPNLRSYKPFVDLTSSSVAIPQQPFLQKLDEWFRQVSKKLEGALGSWFGALESIQDVWSVRSWIRKWVATMSRLELHEQEQLKILLDNLSQQRMMVIWKGVLADAANDFQDQLESSVCDFMMSSDVKAIDFSPVEHLFTASPLPTLSEAALGSSSVSSSFQKYKFGLQRQICGRTVSLDSILGPLETRAKALRRDFSQVASGEDEDTRILTDQLKERYRPDAEALCSRIIDTLELTAETYIDKPGGVMNCVTFVGRVADELSTSSTFLSTIGCGSNTVEDFRAKAVALDARITSQWRKYIISRTLAEYWVTWRTVPCCVNSVSCPSTALMRSLISLSTSLQHLGSSREPSRWDHSASDTLRLFVRELLQGAEEQPTGWRVDTRQALWDVTFLQKLAHLWINGWNEISGLLDEKMVQLQVTLRPEDVESVNRSISEYFSRTQVLLSALIPQPSVSAEMSSSNHGHEKLTALLSHGIPASDTQFLDALELAKPSSRFGLLLVGGTTGH